LELIAERRSPPGSETLDPWFLRRSGSITIQLAEPFVAWRSPAATVARIPLLGRVAPAQPWWLTSPEGRWWRAFGWLPHGLPFGIELDMHPRQPAAPQFDAPPKIVVEVERIDKGGRPRPYATQALTVSAESGRFVARWPSTLRSTGQYRYRYVFSGGTLREPIASPWQPVGIRWGWEYAACGLLVLLALLRIVCRWRDRTATLKGQITVVQPGFWMDDPSGQRTWNADRLRQVPDTVVTTPFTLTAHRCCCLWGWIELRLEDGTLTLDGQTISGAPGATRRLARGLRLVRVDGVDLQINLVV
jgi:hypothetical protein